MIDVSGDKLTLNIGRAMALRKALSVSSTKKAKKALGKHTEELGEIKLNQVCPNYSVERMVKNFSKLFTIGTKFVIK